jgi:hypothetical protein
VKKEIYPTIPSIVTVENHEEFIKLSNQFNAIPVFAGMRLKCISTESNGIAVYGAEYVAEFTGFKAF